MKRTSVLLLLVTCVPPEGALAPAPTGPRSQPDELRIGAYLPLTGADAAFGADSRLGIALAAEEINLRGGIKQRKLTVLFEDDHSRAADATQAAQALVDRDGAVALLGEIGSTRTIAAAVVADARRVPMLTPSATAREVTEGRGYVFRSSFTDAQQGSAAARFARELGRKRAAILLDPREPYSSVLATSFAQAFEKLGGKIAANETYAAGETSFAAPLGRIKDAAPDVVFVPVYATEMAAIARQAKALELAPGLFLGGDGWDSPAILAADLEGAHFTTHFARDLPWEKAKSFSLAFTAKHHREPTSLAAEGYDALLLLADAAERAEEIAPEAIKNALAATKGFAGATGTFGIEPTHDASKPVIVVKIAGGALRYAAHL